MKMLETIEAEIEFTAGGNERREADLRLVQTLSQNGKLLKALHKARDEIAAPSRTPPAVGVGRSEE